MLSVRTITNINAYFRGTHSPISLDTFFYSQGAFTLLFIQVDFRHRSKLSYSSFRAISCEVYWLFPYQSWFDSQWQLRLRKSKLFILIEAPYFWWHLCLRNLYHSQISLRRSDRYRCLYLSPLIQQWMYMLIQTLGWYLSDLKWSLERLSTFEYHGSVCRLFYSSFSLTKATLLQ